MPGKQYLTDLVRYWVMCREAALCLEPSGEPNQAVILSGDPGAGLKLGRTRLLWRTPWRIRYESTPARPTSLCLTV